MNTNFFSLETLSSSIQAVKNSPTVMATEKT